MDKLKHYEIAFKNDFTDKKLDAARIHNIEFDPYFVAQSRE